MMRTPDMMLGQTGETTTTESPAPAMVCSASMIPFMPEEVTVIRSTSRAAPNRPFI